MSVLDDIVAGVRVDLAEREAQTSLTDIARLAAVPLPSLYDYFKDKQALVAAVPEANYLALYTQLAGGKPSADGPADARRQLREIFVANLLERAAHCNAGIIDEHINAAMLVRDDIRERSHRRAV